VKARPFVGVIWTTAGGWHDPELSRFRVFAFSRFRVFAFSGPNGRWRSTCWPRCSAAFGGWNPWPGVAVAPANWLVSSACLVGLSCAAGSTAALNTCTTRLSHHTW